MSAREAAAATPSFPLELARVRAFGDESDPYWLAASNDGSILPQPGEQLLWAGHLVGLKVPGRPEMRQAWLTITDQRIAFSGNDFDKGNTYHGFGFVGVAVSVAATARSHHSANKRRQGHILVGQLRLEWVNAIRLRRQKGHGAPTSVLDIQARMSQGNALVSLQANPPLPFEFASWLASVVAHHRLTSGCELHDARPDLEKAASGSHVNFVEQVPHDFVWRLPGTGPALLHACQTRFLRLLP